MKNKKLKIIYKIVCSLFLFIMIITLKDSSIVIKRNASNINLNKNLNLNAMARVIDNFRYNDLNSPLDTFNGKLTGYVADCPLCSGKLGCNGQDVLDRTVTYMDNTYGTVRIVASSKNLPCGSIVRFDNNTLSTTGEITAIVLDRGVLGTDLDLLVESNEIALTKVGNEIINYDVLRFGWNRNK